MRIKAQTLSEYAIVIGVVAIALMTMQIYAKRGLQGRIKDVTDAYIGLTSQEGNFVDQYVTKESSSYFNTNEVSTANKELLGNDTYSGVDSNNIRRGTQFSVASEEWLDLLPEDNE